MSDLIVTTLIVSTAIAFLVFTTMFLMGRTDAKLVRDILPSAKCVCGHQHLNWNNGTWLIDHHQIDPRQDTTNDSIKPLPSGLLPHAGYIFECPICNHSLWFTRNGEFYLDDGEIDSLESETV